MPRETITPLHNHRLETPEGGRYVPLPVVHVGWMQDLTEVQIGLEYQDLDGQPGTYSIVDALYGDAPTQTQIGRLLVATLTDTDNGLAVALREHEDAQDSDTEAEALNRIGRIVLDCVTGSSAAGGYTSLWTHLDRPAINRLIRLARTARDKAFGRDE